MEAIKVLASNGVKAVLSELAPQFEQSTGGDLAVTFDRSSELKKRIEAGEIFDVAILTAPMIDDLIRQRKIAAGTVSNIARSGVGVAVRAGAPKPDIGTVEAFKRTLLDAKSVAYTTEGASGMHFASVLQRLRIADAVNAKSKTQPGGSVAELVAGGDAELAVQQISELLPVAGTEVVGPFPPELQNFTLFTAGLAAVGKAHEGARALVKFLTAPSIAAVLKAKGMEPG
ncbi:MAG: substrate-binding domain-containing protein [Xanthobacteraceae bacterium]